jgi:hypothetical protein
MLKNLTNYKKNIENNHLEVIVATNLKKKRIIYKLMHKLLWQIQLRNIIILIPRKKIK